MSTKESQKKKKMDPESYAKVIRAIELEEIYMESCSATLKREGLLKQKKMGVSVGDKASYDQHNNRVKVSHKYDLKLIPPETEKNSALKISCVFSLTFRTDCPFTKEFFDVFKDVNLPLNSWPYFREFVQNMTQRMNIPPLTLPFVKRA